MEFLNKIELKGVVGKINYADVGEDTKVTFSLVTEHVTETKLIETTWFECVGFFTQVPTNNGRIQKGDHAHVVGRLRIRRYTDADGNEMKLNEVVVQSLEKIED